MATAVTALMTVMVLSLCAAVLADEKRVKEGDNAEFACNYPSSYQKPRIEWKYISGQDITLIYYNGALTVSYAGRTVFYQYGLMLKSVTRKDVGIYVCEATDSSEKPLVTELSTTLVVLVPPSVPIAQVPTSVTIGKAATLYCVENDAAPRPTFTWYKNKIKMPEDPKSSPTFQNSTYIMDPVTGELTFNPVMKADSGDYSCEATNDQGRQSSATVTMEAYETNVGGIVAAVIIVLLILGLIGFGVWFAYSRGYIGKKANKKVIYSQPSETRSDKNFQQTSSFVV
ncbi:junctional adhesion molecule A isoform X2 [Dendrobates tinctorius]|uniref:junctional adhesion molecule A isoform X2 n=1 Tax=Dendrobates tinctorius TaxID=92724 RepID=UPI003CCA202C